MDFSQPELDALARGFRTLAVTGTNGKSSTTSMLASMVRADGQLDVRVTTLGMWVGDEQVADDTSMASFVRALRRGRELGASTLALELTSRALEAGFAERWPADVAVFTNLTHDHLDRHVTPERYLAAKAQLFIRLRAPGIAVLNAADPASALLARVVPPHVRCTGFLAQPGDLPVELEIGLRASRVLSDESGLRIELADSALARELGGELQAPVLGEFQADNALGAALAAASAGIRADSIRRGLAAFSGIAGRFEACSRVPLVIVDYAHSPDALARVLASARSLARGRGGRLGCVFGCGGDRDRDKRPRMGEIADDLSDVVWLTTDNPRGEAPQSIAAMVRSGMRGRAPLHEQPDRREAIHAAVRWAGPRDVLVVAGRGHETHQELAGERVPFSDSAVAREAISQRK